MNKILLVYYPIGPTFKDRVKSNLKTFESSYRFFDTLIVTDDIHYFSEIESENVKLLDLEQYRKYYSEFNEFEYLPEEKRNDRLYRKQFLDLLQKGKRFSIHLQRFAFLHNDVKNYKYISILDCDMIPEFTEGTFFELLDYVENVMPTNSVSTNRCDYEWNTEKNLKLLEKYAQELNKHTQISFPIQGFDGLFKLYKFESHVKTEEFFNVWNFVLLDLFKSKDPLLYGSWNILIEQFLAIVHKLIDINFNKETEHYRALKKFKSYNFPEDRFWEDWTHKGFETVETKEEFININYEKLKNYYIEQGLKFPY